VQTDIYIVKVTDRSFTNTLREFSSKENLRIKVEYVKDKIVSVKIGTLSIQKPEDSIIDCTKDW